MFRHRNSHAPRSTLVVVVDQTLETKAALLEAAIEVIEESGESGFRISTVLERVGVASTAIYHHYGSRDDLVDSANAERYLRTLYVPNHAQFAEEIARSETAEEFFAVANKMIEAGGSEGATSRRRTRVAVLGSAVSRPTLEAKVHEANAIYARSMAEAFAPAVERGWVQPIADPEVVAMWVIGQSTGRLMAEIGGPVVDIEQWQRVEAAAVLMALTGMAPQF